MATEASINPPVFISNTYRCNAHVETNPKNIFLNCFFNDEVFGNVLKTLHQENIYTLGNITFMSKKDLMQLDTISNGFFKKLTAILKKYNLQLKKGGNVKTLPRINPICYEKPAQN